ncbi:MAG: hypothetical protein AB7U75_16430 [Hyphomicrobiaceae bacterium]
MSGLLRPQDLMEITAEEESKKMDEERRLKEHKLLEQKHLREAFLSREIHAEAIERINHAVSVAARQGHNQLQVLTFPSKFCTDGGRRINIADPDWPSTLDGFAKKAFDFYQKELRPLGYKLHAEIINFPGGMPGDVGLFLKW